MAALVFSSNAAAQAPSSAPPEQQRRVQVVRASGQPVEGAYVYVSVFGSTPREQRALNELLKQGPGPAWLGVQRNTPWVRTQAGGWATIPFKGEGILRVAYQDEVGALHIPAEARQPLRLELAPRAGFWLELRDRTGRPIPQADVRVSAIPTRRLLGVTTTTNPDGRAWVRTEFTQDELQGIGLEDDQARLQLMVALPCATRVNRVVRLDRHQDLVVEVDGLGTARVRMTGYPQGTHFALQGWSASDYDHDHPVLAAAGPDEEGWWDFIGVPVQRKYQVIPYRPQMWEGRQILSPLDYPQPILDGPADERQGAVGDFSMDRRRLIRGRLLSPDGSPFRAQPEERILTEAYARPVDAAIDPFPLRLELREDGFFDLSLREQSPVQEFDQLAELLILVRDLERLPSGWASNACSWAFVPLEAPAGRSVELGEVRLGKERPLLALRVVDAAGQPIDYARVRLDTEFRRLEGGKWAEAALHGGGGHTGADGIAYLVGFDFDQAAETNSAFGTKTGRLRARVEHLYHAGAELVFDRDARALELTLGEAHALQGNVRMPHDLPELELYALEPGGGPDRWGNYRAPSVKIKAERQSGQDADGNVLVPFQLWQLKPASYDLIVYSPSARRVIQRLDGIVVDGTTQLPETLDLAPLLDRYEFQITLPDGRPATPARAERYGLGVLVQHGDGRGARPGWAWTGSSFVSYAVRGVADPRWITGIKLKSIPITDWAPGRHQVKLDRFDRIAVRYPNPHRRLFAPKPIAGWHRLEGLDSPDDMVDEKRPGADEVVEIPGPGRYEVSFFLPGEGQQILSSIMLQVEITAEQIAADEIIEIEVPAALYKY